MGENTVMFIVFEGIDGTGKSTQVKMLAETLRERGMKVVTSFEPTNGTYGSMVRNSATRPEGRYSLEEEFQLFLKDRKEHVETLIKPALDRGEVVILDRYYFSTMAYQGARGMDVGMIREKNEEFALQPDLVILLTVSVEESLKRIGVRDGEGNAFEQRESLEKCSEIFHSLEDPFVHFIASRDTPAETHEDVRRLVLGYLM